MRELPILFSKDMVLANLAGIKNQTRRIFKDHPRLGSDLSKVDLKAWMGDHPEYVLSFCPYGKPGDILWVRETWKSVGFYDDIIPQIHYQYKDDVSRWVCVPSSAKLEAVNKWRPSIHMPKVAARIWLQVTDVQVEKLQAISEKDADQEGVCYYPFDGTYHNYFKTKGLREVDGVECLTAISSFQSLWCSINGIDSWDANPWVWVVKYKVLSTTGRENIPKDILLQLDGKEVEK